MTALPDFNFFRLLADASSKATLPLFRNIGSIDNKLSEGFDPVTQADKNAEIALRAVIEQAYPEHGILGEEFGEKAGDGVHQWVIDPIDGTRAFISGLPVWGTLVGLNVNGRAVAGMMYQPFTDELYVGDGNGAWLSHRGGMPQPLRCRQTALADATLFTTSPALHTGTQAARYRALEAQVKLPRYGVDCYAFAMVAAGHADIAIESGLQAYDIVGLVALVERAGGVVTTWDGGRPENGGDCIACGSAALHAKALAILNS